MTGPQCQSISITDDSILENNEMFVVALSTTDHDVILSPSTTSVTILDDDGNANSKIYPCYLSLVFVNLYIYVVFASSILF